MAADIENLIRKHMPEAHVAVTDLRGDGRYYTAYIESPAFAGKSRVDQHRMVYRILRAYMGENVENLSIQTALPKDLMSK